MCYLKIEILVLVKELMMQKRLWIGCLGLLLVGMIGFQVIGGAQAEKQVQKQVQKPKPKGEAKVVLNGFDMTNCLLDMNEVKRGGPPRDGIPSIDEPKFVGVDRVDYLKDSDIVLGVVRGKVARAYPTRILIWHEIVNDVIGKESIAVTYCPLCGTGMVFDRFVDGQVRSFGVSGLLYRSDVLMYDREDEGVWSQLGMKSVAGKSVGKGLKWLPSDHMTWGEWKKKYPMGEVLSTDTGFKRSYERDAYAGYFASDETMFPVPRTRQELKNKEWVMGVKVKGKAKAYLVKGFKAGEVLEDTVGGETLFVSYDAKSRHPKVVNVKGERMSSVMVFWFAWQAFYPETGLWTGDVEVKDKAGKKLVK